MLRKSMLDVTQRATQSQALKKITAGYELLPASEHGIRYILWAADAAHSKPKPASRKDAAKTFRDPFAKENLEQDLFVTQLHGTHNLVLNKFNVVDEHVVLPTIEFAPQEQPLDAADLRAMWTAMQGLDAFAFFNCGFESGASQPHKHMQLMTYPSMKAITGLDMPPLLHFIDQKLREYLTTETVQLPGLPFCHFLHRINLADDVDSEKAAADIVAIYDKVLEQMNSTEYPRSAATSSTPLPVAYNLLLTSSFLFLIPRKAQGFNGIEVNAIGFIGSFFVRNDEQRGFFETHGGPMELLRQVTFPPTPIAD
ncbi:bifunctional AP-4-A phosphorylase/ADP sulfurylase [Phytophthora pseudosyringae]|uniref:Bifunctional AP-4-A phosphorylase/ADP sulfurylase n=1 Tax=Phytophthora pseudosyringae TaxID=221518 RepID=A0A8T1VLC8_9STRA|nr:bifunctional AP-4-A phosphorylase/ADP sulfurylase [Phytophthora pseudosyringae]